MNKIQEARIRKTKWFFEDRGSFMSQLVKDIEAGIRKADREGLIPVFRLNGTSDIRWERIPVQVGPIRHPSIMTVFPDVQFYDYTKLPNRRNVPENYHLTFSRSESNDDKLGEAIGNGMNVAVVFQELPETYLLRSFGGLPVVNGDETDLRFLDPSPCVVGLSAKGDAKKDNSGFVVEV